jgi:hypothetical protein
MLKEEGKKGGEQFFRSLIMLSVSCINKEKDSFEGAIE